MMITVHGVVHSLQVDMSFPEFETVSILLHHTRIMASLIGITGKIKDGEMVAE